jgi:hypothetical protein
VAAVANAAAAAAAAAPEDRVVGWQEAVRRRRRRVAVPRQGAHAVLTAWRRHPAAAAGSGGFSVVQEADFHHSELRLCMY